MFFRAAAVLATTLLIGLMPVSALAIDAYTQDFEALIQPDTAALGNDGWVVYGTVFDSAMNWLYGYGTFPAPNDGFAFCQIDVGQGGVDQGAQQLSVFSDYQNGDHAAGNIIEASVFREQTIALEDVGDTWIFFFEAKLGNIEGSSTAAAFIKTIDPASNYDMTNYIFEDMTATPVTWTGYTLEITIDAGLVGQLLQIGFTNQATLYQGSGIFYDNVQFYLDDATDVPNMATAGAQLHPNYPNPFNPMTTISFTTDRDGAVDVGVFDLAGRRVATLLQTSLEAGDHEVSWNGTTDTGAAASAGQYRCVLQTATGQVSRSMILLK